jgi:hypothetical protein
VGYLAAGMLKALQQGDIETRLRALEAVEVSKSQKPRSKVHHDDPPAPVPTACDLVMGIDSAQFKTG